MNFIEFTKIFGNNRIIDIRNVETYFDGLDRRRLYEWQKNGHIIKISNNYYIFSGRTVDNQALRTIASQIYKPSYIALESALSYYNFIPEAVFQTISLTTRRNKMIQTKIGNFTYRSIKQNLFFGYNALDLDNDHFFISDPEKTLLDFLYFMPQTNRRNTLNEFRFNLEEISKTVNLQKIKSYLKLFDSPKLNTAVHYLEEMIHAEL